MIFKLDEELYKDVKKQAFDNKCSVAEIIRNSLRSTMGQNDSQ